MRELLTKDPITGREVWYHAADEGDNPAVYIENVQDVTAMLDENVRDYNAGDHSAKGTKGDLRHAARLDPVTLYQLEKVGIMKGYKILDVKRLKAWLNDSANRKFRSWHGRV